MARDRKSAHELEELIAAQLNAPTLKLTVYADASLGWRVFTGGDAGLSLVMQAQVIGQQLREHYDLKEE